MLEDQSVEKILQSIKTRQLSIKELMEYYLNRIDKINPDLNAIILLKDRETLINEAIKKDNLNNCDLLFGVKMFSFQKEPLRVKEMFLPPALILEAN